MNRTIGSVMVLAWYLYGLALLFKAGYIGWMVLGIILPIIPWFYAIYANL